MKLIVGLGNPGPKYAATRHNIGFIFIDALVEAYAERRQYKAEFKAETQRLVICGEQVIVAKPQTFMNLSGESVQLIAGMFKIPVEDILVVHDEIDIKFGQLRFQTKRGHGGHNGIRSVHQMLGSDAYARLRLGVGRPANIVDDTGKVVRPSMEVHEYVLQNFSREEQSQLGHFIEYAADGLEVWIKEGIQAASTKFNKDRA